MNIFRRLTPEIEPFGNDVAFVARRFAFAAYRAQSKPYMRIIKRAAPLQSAKAPRVTSMHGDVS
ncbi:protein of unknown function [Aminobacter niigataensis]|nr:protein of unknown function [Aminobacter niigataensis]